MGVTCYLTPFAHTALFRRVSMRTSGVPISFIANLRISLMARGARFLKELQERRSVLEQHTNPDVSYEVLML